MSVISLITDFGTRDGFAAEMKGVMLGINPGARIVDITHDIEPADIRGAAFVLRTAHRAFPAGTVFCAVVDPGVGSVRAALVCSSGGYFFTGPDNGLLSLALACHEKPAVIRRIENERFMHTPVSATFHGRDIFAPTAAYLSSGVPVEEFGPPVTEYVKLSWPAPRLSADGVIESEIIHIDRFGNAFTAITGEHLGEADLRRYTVIIEGQAPVPILTCYAQVPAGTALALLNAAGFLEIAVNGGNAARVLDLKIGSRIRVHTPNRYFMNDADPI